MTIRCTLDGLLLHAEMHPSEPKLVAFDGDEAFFMEAIEATFYEIVEATPDEMLLLEQARYRLLRQAPDFQVLAA